jgi:palmitoyl-protein thioesterase
VERYSLAIAPVHNLITFGSQHMGISDIPPCGTIDLLCRAARDLAKKAVYGNWAQENLVQVRRFAFLPVRRRNVMAQAQYFRDPARFPTYLEANHFLTSINNEIPESRNETYARGLASLNKLVLVLFDSDQTVFPKETSWFGSEAVVDEYANADQTLLRSRTTIIPMREQPLYVEDWIGLRTLDERGGVVFETCKGRHMQIGNCWEYLVQNYTGTVE